MSYIGNKVKNKVPVDILYSIGLFHDCGIPLLALKYQNYPEILKEAHSQQCNTIKLKELHYKTNHAALGYYIASSWNLPREICQLIAQHHELDYLIFIKDHQMQLIYVVLKIAENMVAKVKKFSESPDWESLQNDVLDIVDLSHEDYHDLKEDFAEFFKRDFSRQCKKV